MIQILHFLLPLCCLPFCASEVTDVVQTPLYKVAKTGESVSVKCSDDRSNYLTKYWYRQKDRAIVLMGYSYNAEEAQMEKDFPKDKMKINADTSLRSTLTISKVSVDDSAIYFCASSIRASSGNKLEFGGGTTLSVLENGEEQRPPKVKIFGPSKQEFKDHNLISLVCVASGFYPEHVQLNWTINGIPRNGLYQNVASKKEKDTSFSTSKRLTLTRSEYFNTENTFRCEAGFIGNDSDAFDEVKGKQDCGVSKESYAMYINQGKISYIMVLFKSGLYALIVLGIIWRRKVLSGSC